MSTPEEREGLRLRSGKKTSPVGLQPINENDGENSNAATTETTKTSSSTETNTWTHGTDASGETGGGESNSEDEMDTEQDVVIREKKAPQPTTANSTTSSADSVRRRKELEAKKRLVELQLREAALARALAQAEYDLAIIPAETEASDSSNFGETTLNTQRPPPSARAGAQGGGASGRVPIQREIEGRQCNHDRVRAQESNQTNELTNALASALKYLKTEAESSTSATPAKYLHELPIFDGDISEWISFKTVYEDTKHLFSEPQNIARLRKALKGGAKETVKSLLYSGAYTHNVMDSLERRYGRPEILIMNELNNIKKMPRLQEDGRNIASFASKVANCVASIKALKKPQYLYSPELTNRIADKLNLHMKFRWYSYSAMYPEDPDLERMSNFLTEMSEQCGAMVAYEEERRASRPEKRPEKRKPVHTAREYESDYDTESESEYESDREEPITTVATVNKAKKGAKQNEKTTSQQSAKKETKRIDCPMCEETHTLKDCEKFRALNYDERWEKAKEARVCFRCLAQTHRRFTCRAKPCGKEGCKAGHHRLLHKGEENKGSVASPVNAVIGEHTTYLKIVPVELHGPKGKKETFALLDEGSTMTLIEERTALEVVPRGKADPLSIEGIGGKRTNFDKSFKLTVKIKGRFERKLENMTAYTIGPLNLATQAISKELVQKCAHLSDIEDQLVYERARPTILIGQDNWHLITSREIKEGDADQPVASYTSLGWVLHGREKGKKPVKGSVHHVTMERGLDTMIKEHFSLESLGIEAKKPSNDLDQRALEVLETTTKQLPSGRYETGLLWKTNSEVMPENRQHAERRLYSIERKLERDSELRKEYSDQIKNLIAKKYAEEISEAPISPRTWYLPHFAVRHPQKGKIRLVFDAAARVNGRSLNDALLAGPDLLLQSLFGILARFREGRVAVIADIKEMFLQIKIREEDRDSLRFLWRDNKGETVKEYRMTSLIFGAASSPCTAIYVKNKNAEKFKETFPETAAAVERHFYMDDYLQAFESAEAARKAVKEMQIVHSKAKFELRGWASNDLEALRDVEENNTSPTIASLGDKEERTLGLIWKIKTDTLSFALNLRNTPEEAIKGERPPTKREVTSAVMSIFDPLGLASPITIQGKELIQNIWRSGIDWDVKLTQELECEWKKWLGDIKMLEGMEIPGNITPHPSDSEMHVFVDASEKAYAAAVYWLDETTRDVSLIAAKAKVTPLKPISIPRLELQAAVLGCRLALTIVLKERAPREEVLHTLLLEVEHVVNSRPLTPVQPDLDKEALTPNHFLIGRSCGLDPIGNYNTRDANDRTWRAAQHLADRFWQRWTKEYLPLLIPRQPASSSNHREPKVGDIVLISDGTMPRGLWPRGEITNVRPGPDSKIRVVEVRTNTGILRRPTSRIIILTRPDPTTSTLKTIDSGDQRPSTDTASASPYEDRC